jgi:uncharacterized membrane protein
VNTSQLPEEQRQALKAAVLAAVRDMLKDREELKAQAVTARRVWQALIAQPTWSVVESQKPADAPTVDEVWSMPPTVIKR